MKMRQNKTILKKKAKKSCAFFIECFKAKKAALKHHALKQFRLFLNPTFFFF
jgi:hypothetical protein